MCLENNSTFPVSVSLSAFVNENRHTGRIHFRRGGDEVLSGNPQSYHAWFFPAPFSEGGGAWMSLL